MDTVKWFGETEKDIMLSWCSVFPFGICMRGPFLILVNMWYNLFNPNYNQTSMAGTSLGPNKFVQDMGRLSH